VRKHLPILTLFLLLGTSLPRTPRASELILVDVHGRVKMTDKDGQAVTPFTGRSLDRVSVLQTLDDGYVLFAGKNRFYRVHPLSTVRIGSEPELIEGTLSSAPSLSFAGLRVVEFGPSVQGHTMKLVVETDVQDPSIDAAILSAKTEKALTLFPAGENRYRALTGLDVRASGERTLTVAMTSPGGEEVHIRRPFLIRKVEWEEGAVYLPVGKGALFQPSEEKERESVELQNVLSRLSKEALWQGPFTYPLREPEIVSGFGKIRRYYINGKLASTSSHRGIDFRAAAGQNVYAPERGVAVFSGSRITTGVTVVLDHGQGVFTVYFHLSQATVEAGAAVEKGEKIGTVGSTGLAAGPHLHWGILVDGVYVDPADWVKNRY
jgi:murein DD-endopeptidase MepM/ murein hydrolase activator NlpD